MADSNDGRVDAPIVGAGVIDVVHRRGKRKDAIVSCPNFFVPGLTVEFARFRVKPERGYDVIGEATVELIDERHKFVKFNLLPEGVKVGDVILINSSIVPKEVLIHG